MVSSLPVEGLVSVILPAFNSRHLICRAIDSVLAQTHATFEILVVDDVSSDGTPEFVAERYSAEPRLKIIRAEHNGGPACARNIGLRRARGAWVALIDADDAWRPDRLERLLRLASGSADLVFDNLIGFDAHLGVETGPLFPGLPEGGFGIAELLAPAIAGSCLNYGYLKPLIRLQFLRDTAIFYDERLRTSEDLVFYLELTMANAAVKTTSAPLYVYTTPVGQQSGAPSPSSNSIPNDEHVVEALRRLIERHGLPDRDLGRLLVEERIRHLRRVGPLASFHYARRKRDLGQMARLAASQPVVRRELYDYARRLLRISPK